MWSRHHGVIRSWGILAIRFSGGSGSMSLGLKVSIVQNPCAPLAGCIRVLNPETLYFFVVRAARKLPCCKCSRSSASLLSQTNQGSAYSDLQGIWPAIFYYFIYSDSVTRSPKVFDRSNDCCDEYFEDEWVEWAMVSCCWWSWCMFTRGGHVTCASCSLQWQQKKPAWNLDSNKAHILQIWDWHRVRH